MTDSDGSGRSFLLATLGFHRRSRGWRHIGENVGRISKWVRKGWYLAFCRECGFAMPFKDSAERDEWAGKHEEGTRHYVDCIDGA